MAETVWSFCPIVRDEVLSLYEHVVVGGVGRLEQFERRILWLRESEAEVTLYHKGLNIDRQCTLMDYGLLSSLERAIQGEVPTVAKRLRIERGDALTVDVDVVIFEDPVMIDESPDGQKHNAKWDRKQYIAVPRDKWYTSDQRIDPTCDWSGYPRLMRREVAKVEGIYSTGKHPIGKIPKDVTKWIFEQRAEATRLAEALRDKAAAVTGGV